MTRNPEPLVAETATRHRDAPQLQAKAVEVGAKLFATKGYETTTTRELSRALGITNGTFYHYFPSKEDLLVQICRHSLSRIFQDVSGSIEAVQDPIERIRTLIRSHVVTMLAQQDLHKTMLTEFRSLSGPNVDEIRRRRDEYESLVRNTLVSAQDTGTLRSDASPRILTLLLLDLLNWAIFWFNPIGSLTPLELGDEMSRVFLEGAAVH